MTQKRAVLSLIVLLQCASFAVGDYKYSGFEVPAGMKTVSLQQ